MQSRSGDNPRNGRVEILNDRKWGLVCADGWDTNDAIVVCQDQYLGNNGTAIQLTYNQSDTLWLNGVNCMGNESKLSFCPHNGIGVIGDCGFIAGVECFGKMLVIAKCNLTAASYMVCQTPNKFSRYSKQKIRYSSFLTLQKLTCDFTLTQNLIQDVLSMYTTN